ncbi:MAG: tetratricopeptide repeat protein, partial [Gammaproteobacteria bacterium]
MKNHTTATDSDLSGHTDTLTRAKSLIQSARFTDAINLLTTLASRTPVDAVTSEARYILAVAYRYEKDYPSALHILDELVTNHPDMGRAYQEQGYNYLALNRANDATKAFELAVNYNPGLVASWKALISFYDLSGHTNRARLAQEQLTYLESLPRDLVAVIDLIHEGRLYK